MPAGSIQLILKNADIVRYLIFVELYINGQKSELPEANNLIAVFN